MTKQNSTSDAITAEDVLGKDVVDSHGEFIGVTDKLYLDPKTLEVQGLSVDKGFLRKGLVIGADYVDRVTPHAVMLNIRPPYRLRGMLVFDKHGARVGKVTKVALEQDLQSVSALTVKDRLRRGYDIPQDAIERIEHNVFLTVEKDALERVK